MRIGNKNIPYPVLNQDKTLTDYKPEVEFSLTFEVQKDGNPIIENGKINFKNLHFQLTDTDLISYIHEGKLKGALIVECSASLYRKSFPITMVPQDLYVDLDLFSKDVIVSAYLYACENIPNFTSHEFQSLYESYTCSLDKYDIVAVDDGFKFSINQEPEDVKNVASIFLILIKEENDNRLTYLDEESHIVLQLPAKQFESYEALKNNSRNDNIAFALIAIPVLTTCLLNVQKAVEDQTYSDIQDLIEDKRWMLSVIHQYKNVTGNDLTLDGLVNQDALTIAQIVLNNAICNGITDFENILFDFEKGDGDDDE